MKKLILLMLPLVLLLTNCKKTQVGPAALPAVTQTGANTFGALVNGKTYVPQSKSFSITQAISILGKPADGSLVINTSNSKNNPYLGINIYANGVQFNKGDVISLQTVNTPNAVNANYTEINGADVSEYNIVAGAPGTLTVSNVDADKKIISGTFSFDGVNKNGGKVSVTSGRFDLTYQ